MQPEDVEWGVDYMKTSAANKALSQILMRMKQNPFVNQVVFNMEGYLVGQSCRQNAVPGKVKQDDVAPCTTQNIQEWG